MQLGRLIIIDQDCLEYFSMKYNLPKNYLSYSAAMLWLKTPDLYRRRYYLNEKPEDNVFMGFGKRIAEVLESRDFKDHPSLKDIPFYPISEHKLEVEIGGVPVMGFLDLYEPTTFSFGEIKTGIVSKTNGPPWDKVKVQAHEQLPWYSLMIKTAYGKVNNKCKLIWIPTRFKDVEDQLGSRKMTGQGKELELIGETHVFERSIAEWERKRLKDLIIKCATEISNDFTEFSKGIK